MRRAVITPCFLVVFLFVVTSSIEAVRLGDSCQSTFFSDETLQQETEELSIYARLYLKVQCELLLQGEYIINTQWMDEQGMLRTEREHKFKLGFPRPYSATFKFKQMPIGSLKSLSSGKDFDDYQYGRWSVLIFLNGEEIERKYFTINE